MNEHLQDMYIRLLKLNHKIISVSRAYGQYSVIVQSPVTGFEVTYTLSSCGITSTPIRGIK